LFFGSVVKQEITQEYLFTQEAGIKKKSDYRITDISTRWWCIDDIINFYIVWICLHERFEDWYFTLTGLDRIKH